MSVNLKLKLAERRVKPTPKSEGIMLPQAFIAKTLKKAGLIPADVDVIVERDCMGNFALCWWNELERPINQTVAKDSGTIDISDVYEECRTALLGAIPTEDLHAEIARRDQLAKLEAKK